LFFGIGTMDDIDRLRDDILREVADAGSPEALEAIRVAALGRRGRLTERMRGLGALDPETRRRRRAQPGQGRDRRRARRGRRAARPRRPNRAARR
jgi:hypothetical protein